MALSQARSQEAPWRGKLQAIIALAMFSGGVIFGLVLLVNYFRESSVITAYRSASACAAPSDALSSQACRLDGQAKVLSTTQDDLLRATIAFDSLPGHSFAITFPKGGGPPPSSLAAGGETTATLWDGVVTDAAGRQTVSNPERSAPGSNLILGPFFGLFGLIGLFFSVRLARIAWRSG